MDDYVNSSPTRNGRPGLRSVPQLDRDALIIRNRQIKSERIFGRSRFRSLRAESAEVTEYVMQVKTSTADYAAR
jgi:hypothetical protein